MPDKPMFTADESICTKCGICAQVCPLSTIRFVQGEFPEMREGRPCIRCGHCMIHCPVEAAHVSCLPDEAMLPIDQALLPTPEAVDVLCKSRRTVRNFKEQPVPKNTIREILEVARYATSAKNMQGTRWVILYERAKIRQLGDLLVEYYDNVLTKDNPKPAAQPDARLVASAWKRGEDPMFRNAPHVAIAVAPASWIWNKVDGAIALTYFELAAHARGIGCCWTGYATPPINAYAPMREFLGIAEDEIACGGQVFGFIARRARRIPLRNPLNIEWME